jgi:anti-sigma-K factor RskA
MTERPDIHTLTGAYAVDALPDDEREMFEQHLLACDACAQEVTELQATAARLSDAAFELPPPSLRDRVLAEIDATRQEPPLPHAAADDGPPAPPTGREGVAASAGTSTSDAAAVAVVADELATRRARRARIVAAVTGVAAALLVVAVGAMAVTLASVRSELDAVTAELQAASADLAATSEQLALAEGQLRDLDGAPSLQVAELMTAEDVVTVAADGEDGVAGRFVVSPDRGEGVFVATGWDKAPHEHAYQLWAIDGDGPIPGEVFDVDDDGRSFQTVTGDLRDAVAVAVTIEPAGGSDEPTTTPILVLELPAATS